MPGWERKGLKAAGALSLVTAGMGLKGMLDARKEKKELSARDRLDSIIHLSAR